MRDVYLANLVWHEEKREVIVLQAEGGPLVGMSMLYGSSLTLEVVDGGNVLIEALG